MTNFLAENFPGLLPINQPSGGKTMNARQWQFVLQSLGMHWAKALLFFSKKPLQTSSSNFSDIQFTNILSDNNFVVSADSKSALLAIPIFCDMVIEHPQTKTKINLVNPMITLNQTRNITKTIVQGKNGTVKEWVSDDDYQIDIDGALFTTDGSYPEEEMNTLIELCKSVTSLSVYNYLLGLFDIKSIVITDYTFKQTFMKDMQLFQLKALSDEPYEIVNFT